MSKIFSKDFVSELTPGKIAAKVLVTGIAAVLILGYQAVSTLVLSAYKHLSQSLYDSLLESVSDGPKDYALFVLIMVYLGSIVLLWRDILNKEQSIKYFLRKEQNNESNVPIPDRPERVKKLVRTQSKVRVLHITTIILFFSALILFYLETAKNEIHRNFHRKTTIISPYITPTQKDMLISNFFSMKKEADYLKINSFLDSVLKQKSLMP